jgi:hypothetical protein
VLVDVTGNSPVHETVVLDPAAVPAAQVARSLAEHDRSSDFAPPAGYGLVYVAVPSGPNQGYAMYAPRVPAGPRNGARPLAILQAGQRVPDATLQTVGEKRTASGARVAARDLTVAHVTGREITLQVRTDATAEQVFVAIDAGGAPGSVTGSPEGAFDGYLQASSTGTTEGGDLLWEVGPLPVDSLPDGVHVARARAARIAESSAVVWNTFVAPFVVDHDPSVGPPLEPLDRDGDGYPSADDNCPDAWNAEQSDYDTDGIGDLCDYCPLDGTAPMLDADGCRALDDASLQQILSTVDDVMQDRASLADLILVIDQVNE